MVKGAPPGGCRRSGCRHRPAPPTTRQACPFAARDRLCGTLSRPLSGVPTTARRASAVSAVFGAVTAVTGAVTTVICAVTAVTGAVTAVIGVVSPVIGDVTRCVPLPEKLAVTAATPAMEPSGLPADFCPN